MRVNRPAVLPLIGTIVPLARIPGAAASMGAREDFEPAPAGLDSITANQRNQMQNMYDHADFPNTQARNWRRLASAGGWATAHAAGSLPF